MIGLGIMLAASGPVILTAEGPPCITKIDGITVANADIPKTMKRLKARRRGILIKFGDVPYKCIGGAIYEVQRTKIKRVTFEPPWQR